MHRVWPPTDGDLRDSRRGAKVPEMFDAATLPVKELRRRIWLLGSDLRPGAGQRPAPPLGTFREAP
ncbi:hypothetical protein Scani_78110 [Streptomyces caniferus]|uniref:Uncharacterized protein n=1 Tax=Streptomyces caniferus TaxID=285557 RepID=A0A640SIY1_9ACTN|nr:hypothetical protein Scani_78110 [Streptomyces caniferus]